WTSLRHTGRSHTHRYRTQPERHRGDQSHTNLYYIGASILSTAEQLPPEFFDNPEQPGRHRNWKRVIVIASALLVVIVAALLIGVFALLHTEGFRQYVIRKAVAEVKDIVGADVHVRDFSFHISGLSPMVDMYDVTIDGAAPY